jgi:SAM-dependent methyltransferase
MKPRLIDYLACPACQSELRCTPERREGDEIIEGRLACVRCRREYPIRGAIPRLVPEGLSPEKQRTAAAFGWEWLHFAELHAAYRDQFLDWIYPIGPSFFADKVVLDAGCGTGRHAYFAAQFGAREVIAFDLSDAVETAYRHLGSLPNAHVVHGDIYSPPFRRVGSTGPFDFIYSIGVLHHLPDPQAGFDALAALLKPGGTIFAWVYGRENNGVVDHVIDPLRRHVTTRLPVGVLHAASWPLTAVLEGVIHGIYRPLRRTPVFARLPLHEYLVSLAPFSFRHNHSIVFDHLVAPTAFYLRREEFAAWFPNAGLEEVELSWRNQNSWRGRGRRPSVAVSGEGRRGQRSAS